jgi:hypothetical protein
MTDSDSRVKWCCLLSQSAALLLGLGLVDQASALGDDGDKRYLTESIFVGQYVGYETHGTVTLSNPPTALYRKIYVLKGPPWARSFFPVKYEFDERKQTGSESANWQFNEHLMPRKGSWWIIFATRPAAQGWEAFDASEGRLEFSRANLDKVLDEFGNVRIIPKAEREEIYAGIEKRQAEADKSPLPRSEMNTVIQ